MRSHAPVTLAILALNRDMPASEVRRVLAQQGHGLVTHKRIWTVRARYRDGAPSTESAKGLAAKYPAMVRPRSDAAVALRDAALRLGADDAVAVLTELFASHGVTVEVRVAS